MDDLPHLNRKPENELDWFEALVNLARFLRTPEGCPWDREQGASDFAGFLEDEVRELREALESGDDTHAEEELGDVLFTLLATAAAAEEEGRLGLENTMRRIHEKMIRRHEHVFGEVEARTAEDALRVWEDVKRREKENQ